MIALQLSRQLDDHDLSDCVVLYFALDTYRYTLKQFENDGLCYPAYFQQANRIIDELNHQLTEALLGLNQVEQVTTIDLMGNLLEITNPRRGGARQ